MGWLGSLLRVAAVAVTLVVYTALAALTYRALLFLWAQRPDPLRPSSSA